MLDAILGAGNAGMKQKGKNLRRRESDHKPIRKEVWHVADDAKGRGGVSRAGGWLRRNILPPKCRLWSGTVVAAESFGPRCERWREASYGAIWGKSRGEGRSRYQTR